MRPIVVVQCAPCHLEGSPMARLDTLPTVLSRKAKWIAYLRSGHMPPSGGLDGGVRQRLVDWAVAGAPSCQR